MLGPCARHAAAAQAPFGKPKHPSHTLGCRSRPPAAHRTARQPFKTGKLVQCAAAASALPGDAEPESYSLSWKLQQLREMALFMVPALTIPMADPVMSMVDTVCLGQFAGTVELASLGPANIVFAFAQYVFQPLNIATIKLMADAVRQQDYQSAQEVLRSVLLVALVCGVGVTCLLELQAQPLLAMTGAAESVLPVSAEYLRIRAFAQPAMMTCAVCQSALLAQRDSRTPALAVTLMAAISALGNVVFVANLRMGVAGAAMTTVATQYIGAVALLAALTLRGKAKPGLQVPGAEMVGKLLRTAGPLSIVYFCKNFTYILLQTAATALSTVQLAAHQAVFAVWNMAAFSSYPVEQAALAFLPASCSRPRLLALVQLLLLLGLCNGVLVGVLASCLPAAQPAFFTQDTALWPLMASICPQVFLSLVLACVDVACNGILLARGYLLFMAVSFTATLGAVALFLRMAQAQGWALGGVWWGVVFFFGVRCLQSGARVLWMLAQRPKSGEAQTQ